MLHHSLFSAYRQVIFLHFTLLMYVMCVCHCCIQNQNEYCYTNTYLSIEEAVKDSNHKALAKDKIVFQ